MQFTESLKKYSVYFFIAIYFFQLSCMFADDVFGHAEFMRQQEDFINTQQVTPEALQALSINCVDNFEETASPLDNDIHMSSDKAFMRFLDQRLWTLRAKPLAELVDYYKSEGFKHQDFDSNFSHSRLERLAQIINSKAENETLRQRYLYIAFDLMRLHKSATVIADHVTNSHGDLASRISFGIRNTYQ